MAEKLLKDMPSFTRTSFCQNSYCSVQVLKTTSTKISIYVRDGNFSMESEVRDYLQNVAEICIYCGHQRDVIIKPTTHILIELNVVPIGKLYKFKMFVMCVIKYYWFIYYQEFLIFRFRSFHKL